MQSVVPGAETTQPLAKYRVRTFMLLDKCLRSTADAKRFMNRFSLIGILTDMERPCQVVAHKFNNQVHLKFDARLTYDDGDLLRVSYPMGTVVHHFTRRAEFIEKTNTEAWFWRSRWYNVYVNIYEDGSLKSFYCNVAMPPNLDHDEIHWIDLDLDVQIFPDGTYAILDEDEFDEHKVKYGYPDDVQARARQAVDEIIALARLRTEPFAHLLVDLQG
jgi:uncharacterized protein